MGKFKIQKVATNSYPYIVFSTSYINPLNELDDIATKLRNKYEGKVLFDLLLSNGNSSNRFIEALFDGKKFVFDSFQLVKQVSTDVLSVSNSFYSGSQQLEKNYIVSRQYKFLLQKQKI